MAHCPYCGTEVKEDEKFCIHCGKRLPDDILQRSNQPTGFNRWWLLPISAVFIALLIIGGTYFLLEQQKAKAVDTFKKAEKLALEAKYSTALDLFEQTLGYKSNFPAATQNKKFMETAIKIKNQINAANDYLDEQNFQQALKAIDNSEEFLKNYNGKAVNELLNNIVALRNTIKVAQLNFELDKNPTTDDLKMLLWKAEAIQSDEAKKIADDIRERIVSYAYSTANEKLKLKQYSKARAIVDDGLKYAPESEKLLSLKTTIEKEKIAFETEQKNRIEQAMDAVEKEREKNKNDAVEMISIEANVDQYGDLVVKGKLKSVATVPIYSVSIKYNLLDDKGNIVETNEVYAYPDTLYPDEEGKFEFTHYDVKKSLDVKVEKVKWFLD